MNARSIWTMLGMIVLTCACKLNSLNDPIVVPEIDKEFKVDIWENLQPTGRTLVFKILTIKPENCENATVSYDYRQVGSLLTMSLNDINAPSDCNPGLSPASADIQAGYLSTGNYALNINLKNTVLNTGALHVNYEDYKIEMETEEGLTFVHRQLKRVPYSAIWGYVTYTENSQEANAQQMVDGIKSITNEANYPEGYYGYFNIAATNSEISVYNQPVTTLIKPFIYDFPGDVQVLNDKLAELRSEAPAGVVVKLFNAKGQEL